LALPGAGVKNVALNREESIVGAIFLAAPWDTAPRYLLRDRDHAFSGWAKTASAMDVREVLTAPRSPWQKGYASYCTSFG
jgi:hypothetical protein